LFAWISNSAQAVHPVPPDFLTPAANIRTDSGLPTEAQFNTLLQSLFQVYGERMVYQVPAGVTFIGTVDNFTRVQPSSTNQRYNVVEYATEKQISLSVKVFDSTSGLANLIPSQFLA